jgi:signal transduction histidine kinase
MRLTRSLLGDAALAAALTVIGVIGTIVAYIDADRPPHFAAFAMVVGAALALTVRRRWPLATLAVAAVLAAAYLVFSFPYGPILFSFFIAVYTVARHEPLNRSWPAAGAALALLITHLLTNEAALPGLLGLGPITAWVVVPFAIGVTVRISRQAVARERAETVRRRVYDERLQVAQEVHDVVGHGLAAIKMQADIALHLLARKPKQAETALIAISRTSAEALDELRATLAAVRSPGPGGARSPVSGLNRLDDLRRRMESAGLRVEVETSGTPRALPAAVDLAGYRVVQESLTNVLRHADAMVATVRIGYETDAVVIEISNPATPAAAQVPAHADGLGIPGMRERVTSLGGDFAAGTTADGRFEVHAAIPTGGRP